MELELLEGDDSLTIPLPRTAFNRISFEEDEEDEDDEDEEDVTGRRVDTDATVLDEGTDDIVVVEATDAEGVETTVITCPLCNEFKVA